MRGLIMVVYEVNHTKRYAYRAPSSTTPTIAHAERTSKSMICSVPWQCPLGAGAGAGAAEAAIVGTPVAADLSWGGISSSDMVIVGFC